MEGVEAPGTDGVALRANPRRRPAVDIRRQADTSDSAYREAFVRNHWLDAYRAAYLISCDRAASEDIAQEAMLKALASLGSLDADRPASAWVRRIAINATYDWLRRAPQRREVSVEDPEDLRLAGDESVASEVGDLALGGDLTAALSRVPIAFRLVLVMSFLADMSGPEIASALDVQEGTVRSRIHRGLALLRNELQSDQGEGNAEQAQ